MDPHVEMPRPSRRPPWWVPLLIPAITLTLIAIDSASQGTHVVHPRAIGAVVGGFFLCVLVALPAFLSGILYNRQTRPTSY